MPNEPSDLSHRDQMSHDRYSYHIYDIEVDPTKTIESVHFDYTCKFYIGASVRLCANGIVTDSRNLTECPCWWKLNRKVKHLKLISAIPLCSECMTTNVVYQDIPVDWIMVAPGESYPLPTEPAEITTIKFDAKTDAGSTSTVAFLVFGSSFASATVTETPMAFELVASGGPYPISDTLLTNIGSSTIYISNLRKR